MSRVVGLDPSLTGFGVAVIERRSVLFAGELDTGELTGRARFEQLLDQVGFRCRGADLVVIEGPSFASRSQAQTGHHERAGLWWAVTQDRWRDGVPTVVVSPRTRAKYGAGNGNAGKADVVAAASQRFGLGTLRSDNVADALTLAAMGARFLLEPIDYLEPGDPLTPKRIAACEAVEWPAMPA